MDKKINDVVNMTLVAVTHAQFATMLTTDLGKEMKHYNDEFCDALYDHSIAVSEANLTLMKEVRRQQIKNRP